MFVFLEFCSCPICKLFLVIFVRHFSQSSKNLSVEAQNLSSKKELLGQKLKILLSSYLQIRERPLHINKNIFTCFKFNAVCGNFPVAILTDRVTAWDLGRVFLQGDKRQQTWRTTNGNHRLWKICLKLSMKCIERTLRPTQVVTSIQANF